MAHWIGAQGRVKVAKKTQKHPHLWRPPQRTSNTKRKKIFQSKLEGLPNPQRVWTALYLNRLAIYGVAVWSKKWPLWAGPTLAGAGPNARPRRGAPQSNGFMT